jgi:hypothetical protein
MESSYGKLNLHHYRTVHSRGITKKTKLEDVYFIFLHSYSTSYNTFHNKINPQTKKHKHAQQRPHSSGTCNSINQHKIMQEENISAVIKKQHS